MMKRRVYQLLLRLHPAAFRERFGEEMLWVFDEMLGDLGSTRLCTDAAFSLVKQHLSDDPVPRSKSWLFQRSPEETLSAVRLFQAGVVASIALSGFLGLLRQSVPLPSLQERLPSEHTSPTFAPNGFQTLVLMNIDTPSDERRATEPTHTGSERSCSK